MSKRLSRAALLLSVVTLSTACPFLFGFEREAEVGQGEIIGRAVAAESGEPTPLVSVSLIGQPPMRVGPLGGFRMTGVTPGLWTVDVRGDDDGDGFPDRRAQRIVRLRAPSGPEEGVYLGDVVLQAPASVAGTAVLEDGPDLPINVVAFRQLRDQESGLSWQSANEARTEVRPDGRWRLDGLAPGRVSIFAFQQVLLGNIHASDPVTIDVQADGSVEGVALTLDERRLVSVPTFIELRPSPNGPVTVVAMRAGTHPDAELRIELDQALDVLINQTFNAPPSGIVQVQVPVGERIDLYFHTGDKTGILFDQSVTASGDAVQPQYPRVPRPHRRTRLRSGRPARPAPCPRPRRWQPLRRAAARDLEGVRCRRCLHRRRRSRVAHDLQRGRRDLRLRR
jgi:hypothetical protein